jgi:hypothetical protein
MSYRVYSLLILVFFALQAAGCATAPSPPPPDLSVQRASIVERTDQLIRLQQWMERDLRQFVELRLALAQSSSTLDTEGFPISLYRFVAIQCLNDALQPRGTTIEQAADIADCRPTHLDQLLEALSRTSPAMRDRALGDLERIDEMRKLNGLLRIRIARTPQLIGANQTYLVEQRAELRQTGSELERRRSLYGSDDYRAAENVLTEHQTILNAFEDAIETLTLAYPEWPTRLDEEINTLYMDLAWLR